MKCYLAHPVNEYGGAPRQLAAIAAIEARGWFVENPDGPLHQAAYQTHGMSHFLDLVDGCDALAFMRFPDGAIGAGVGKEIERALTRRIDVYDVSTGALVRNGEMMPTPVLSVEDTRARVRQIAAL